MNLLKAQDTKLKLTSINPLLSVHVNKQINTTQCEIVIKAAGLCNTNLPAFIKYAEDNNYIIETDKETGLLNFVIY